MTTRTFEMLLSSLDETQLEQWVLSYVNTTFAVEGQAQRIGRRGQAQKGVDVHAVIRDVGSVGYQAKAYVGTRLTTSAFNDELKEAHKFEPPLARYTVVTLNRRDARLQEHARKATLHGQPSVQVLALEDLADIAASNDALAKLLLNWAFSAADVERLFSPFVTDTSALPIRVLSTETDLTLPSELRVAEDWINAGMPRKALSVISSFSGVVTESSRRRLECRALFSLQDYRSIVREVEAEQLRPDPDPPILALGAQAAAELGDEALATEWLTLALAKANDRNRHEVVAAYLRTSSRKDGADLERLEEFAARTLGDSVRVAAALGDVATNLRKHDRALYWYEQARLKRPVLPLGIEVNEICSQIVTAISAITAGMADEESLAQPIARMEGLLPRIRECEAEGYAFVALNALGFAYQAANRFVDAALVWDEALGLCETNFGLWVRRCALSTHEHVYVPSETLIDQHARDNRAKCALAMALTLNGQSSRARDLINSVLLDQGATAEELAIASAERVRLEKVTGEKTNLELAADALSLLRAQPDSPAFLSLAILHYNDAAREQQKEIQELVLGFALDEAEDEAVVALAEMLESKGQAALAVKWLSRIEGIAFDKSGEIVNCEAADAAAFLYLASLRFDDAISVRARLLEKGPRSAAAVQQLARALLESGDREGAYLTLDGALRRGVVSSSLILNWATLASSLGRRRSAKELLSQIQMPASSTPEDYVRILHARILLGLERNDEQVLSGLRQGLITQGNAGRLFGLGLHRRATRKRQITYGSVAKIEIPGVFENTVCISEKPALPLPGILTFDAQTHPWIKDFLGAQADDAINITSGVFQGKQAYVRTVCDATDWVIYQARDLIAISEPDRTGVETFTGDTESHIAVTKERLKKRNQAINESMSLASAAGAPISLLCEQYRTSPREFLHAHAGWVPRSGNGTPEDIAREDAAIKESRGLLFDAVAVLLLVTIGAEELLSALPQRPKITKQSAWQLFDWYLVEREGRRATAHVQLADDGRLAVTNYGVGHRVALLRYWRSVSSVIRERFEVIPGEPLGDLIGNARLGEILGPHGLTALSTAHSEELALVSEEGLLRLVATDIFQAKSASLHRLIAVAAESRWISRTKATVWLSRLIDLGWTWVSFPTWTIDHALRLKGPRRWPLVKTFLSRMRAANPTSSLQTLLHVQGVADANGYSDLDVSRLRKEIFNSLPRIGRDERVALARRFREDGSGRQRRATAKMLVRWADE